MLSGWELLHEGFQTPFVIYHIQPLFVNIYHYCDMKKYTSPKFWRCIFFEDVYLAGLPSIETAILHHHVITASENRQNVFVFVYRSGIETKLLKKTHN